MFRALSSRRESRSFENKIKTSVEALCEFNKRRDVDTLRKKGIEGLAEELDVDLANGVDTREGQNKASLKDRENMFGKNKMIEIEEKTFFSFFLEQINDPVIILLIIAATISTILGFAITEERKDHAYIDGVAIWMAVLFVATIGATNEYRQEQQFRQLNAKKEEFEVTVMRNGKEGVIMNTELVVGDVLILKTGDRVTADGVLFHNNDLVLDEASISGETETVRKKIDRDPFCRSGTHVTDGSGRILVIAVGKHTEWGEIMELATGDTDKTPLQDKLVDLAAAIGRLGFAVAIASFVAMLVRWMIEKSGFPIDEINEDGPMQFFLFAVTIVVVAVPEGLPLAVTISLSFSMQKMMKDNNFVRVLAACETMGGATCICSDKTGTLTENRMTVVEGWFQGQYLRRLPTRQELDAEVLELITENASLNSEAFLIPEESGVIKFVGNRTECALLVFIKTLNVDYQAVRSRGGVKRIKVYGFNSVKKMSSVVVLKGDDDMRLYNKGAAEMVLPKCTKYLESSESSHEITEEKRRDLKRTIEDMANRGLRTLALTYRKLEKDDFNFSPLDEPLDESLGHQQGFAEAPDENLVLLALVGIKDPVRREVPEAVEQCKHAGIEVRMVTGDNIFTAKHIAKECGILTTSGLSMEGPEFRRRAAEDLEGLKKDLGNLQVLARSSPSDKHTLVTLLRKADHVVAVTGDGTNDAPALREADVGLAMGIAGTEVAKEAADIVILDDNFSSIVKAVLWGRSVLTNIRKFLQFQLTINVVAMGVAFVAALVGGETPLNVLQLLWVNLIMDSLAALALATENPTPDLLNEKPQGRSEALISPTMGKHILLQAFYQFVVIFIILYSFPAIFKRYEIPEKGDFYYRYCHEIADRGTTYKGRQVDKDWCPKYLDCPDPTTSCRLFDEHELRNKSITDFDFRDHIKDEYEDEHDDVEKQKNSVIFNAFIFMQVFNEFNCRKIHNEYNIFQGVRHSPLFCSVTVAIVALQFVIMLTDIGLFFKVRKLNVLEWVFSIGVSIGVIPYSLLIRYLCKRPGGARPEGYEALPGA